MILDNGYLIIEKVRGNRIWNGGDVIHIFFDRMNRIYRMGRLEIGKCIAHAKARRREEQHRQDLQDGTIRNWKMERVVGLWLLVE